MRYVRDSRKCFFSFTLVWTLELFVSTQDGHGQNEADNGGLLMD